MLKTISKIAFDFEKDQMNIYWEKNETESFRFINWQDLFEESVTLPIDKTVVGMINQPPSPKGEHPCTKPSAG